MLSTLTEIKKGHTGTGLLIENDGYAFIKDPMNNKLNEALEPDDDGNIHIPYPFVVSAVFQKYGIENANGRIYPEDILKREVEKYQQAIKEKRAYGECYKPDTLILTDENWKPLSEIKEGDNVLTLNTVTNKTEMSPVRRVIKHSHNGKMIRIKGNGIDDIVTPKHNFPVYSLDDFRFDRSVTAEEFLAFNTDGSKYIPNSLDNIKDGIILSDDISVTEEDYNGDVMCVEVNNHNWFCKCNGKAHWTHNCNHPSSSSIDVGRIAMNIIELHWEGHTLVGQMEIPISYGFRKYGIVSTCADQVAQWIISGLKIGVSSRALGSVTQQGNALIVGDDLELVCWDVVSQPSTTGAWIEPSEEKLHQYIESEKKKGSLIAETENNKFDKFKDWLKD